VRSTVADEVDRPVDPVAVGVAGRALRQRGHQLGR
jgi:hypothetical protein